MSTLFNEVQARTPELIQLRRQLHQCPETAWQETETTHFLRRYLSSLPLTVYPLPIAGHDTGLMAVLSCGKGPVLTLRFDIDALPVTETTSSEHLAVQQHFVSRNHGCMHACGHDGHMAIGLMTAAILCQHRDMLHGTVQFLFQPAEEGCRGARPIAESSLLDSTDYFLSGHIVPSMQYPEADGDFIFVDGSFATTKLDVSYQGKAAHAAHPQEGRSVIPALGELFTSLYRLTGSTHPDTVLNIGKIQAGSARNILAARAVMEMECRGKTTKANMALTKEVEKQIKETARTFGLTYTIQTVGSAPSLKSSPSLADRLSACFENTAAPVTCSHKKTTAFLASEDAAHLMDRVTSHGKEAAYVLFPARTTAVLHQPDYSFDETVLARAVLFYTTSALQLLK